MAARKQVLVLAFQLLAARVEQIEALKLVLQLQRDA
jgi:hypothetical protein